MCFWEKKNNFFERKKFVFCPILFESSPCSACDIKDREDKMLNTIIMAKNISILNFVMLINVEHNRKCTTRSVLSWTTSAKLVRTYSISVHDPILQHRKCWCFWEKLKFFNNFLIRNKHFRTFLSVLWK